jgi:hypothetical protein
MMPRNLGKIRFERKVIEGQPYGIAYSVDSGKLWRDHAPETPGCIWIVVEDNGRIAGAGPDPSWNLIDGYDIWEVAHGGDYREVVGKHWDGSKIHEG